MIIILWILCLISLPFIAVLFLFALMWLFKLLVIFIEFLDDHLPNNY